MPGPEIIAFDADDTLWHNESIFSITHEKFGQMLAPFHDAEWVEKMLYETELKNLALFGYGVKGFTLSMIETALQLSENRIGGEEVAGLIEAGKEMLRAPVDPLPHVRDVLETLAATHELMLITKGDLFDQESKIARSGFGPFFKHVEIVSKKEPAVYHGLLKKHAIAVERFVMVGNSLRSDIFPVIALGAQAIHIPYDTTWQHEHADPTQAQMNSYHRLADIRELPALIRSLHTDQEAT